MAELLDIKIAEDEDGEKHLTEEQEKYLSNLHRETEVALQIFLATGEMKAGIYEANPYDIDWKYRGEK